MCGACRIGIHLLRFLRKRDQVEANREGAAYDVSDSIAPLWDFD